MNALKFKVTREEWSAELCVPAGITLHQLAETIIDAVGFDFDHCFGFYENLEWPHESEMEYTLFADIGEDAKENDPGVRNTTVSTAFHAGGKMIFLFDYGDDWMFLVECLEEVEMRAFKRPKILSTSGTPPEQYPDFD